jgi:GxxExxY protein
MGEAKGKIDLLHAGITESIIGAFYLVYNELGYGFLEKIYVEALVRVLRKLGHKVDREILVPVEFFDEVIALQRLDLLVDDKVVVEVKSTRDLAAADHRQLRSYLSGTRLEVGLLLHFGPEAKFYRSVCTNSGKPKGESARSEESAGSAPPTA